MLWTIIVILFILWLLGAFGGRVFSGFPTIDSNWVHIIVVVAAILLILKLLNVI
jgi:hypothetical protein